MTAAEWRDRYRGAAVCPAGHEFRGEWYDSKRAALTCPVCAVIFEATWPGFPAEPETVVITAEELTRLQIGHKPTPSETRGDDAILCRLGTTSMRRRERAHEARSQ